VYCGARYWAGLVSTGQRDGAALGGRYFELRFEDLMLNSEKTAAELGNFINQGANPEQVQNLVDRVDRTKRPENVQLWKQNMDENQRYLCEAAAGNVLRACGYPTEFDLQGRQLHLKKAFYLTADFAVRVRNRLKQKLRRVSL
jgi:hypothetical protein